MGEKLVADLIVDRLLSWGVTRVFGYSGDGINAFMGALRRAAHQVEFVQARHEENAAFMAVGHAKYSGGVGVVTSTQGPGAIHLLNGLYDAKLDGVPVVAIVGQQNSSVLGSGYMQEVDLLTLVKDVAAQFAQQIEQPRAGTHGVGQGVSGCAHHQVTGRHHRSAGHAGGAGAGSSAGARRRGDRPGVATVPGSAVRRRICIRPRSC